MNGFFICGDVGEARREPRTFAFALNALKAGVEVRRRSWETGLTIALAGKHIQVVARRLGSSHRSPWIATDASLLADDWEIVKGRRR